MRINGTKFNLVKKDFEINFVQYTKQGEGMVNIFSTGHGKMVSIKAARVLYRELMADGFKPGQPVERYCTG